VLQAGFAGPQRRTSFVGILHQMSAQNRLLYTQAEEARRLSTGDVTADSPTTDDDPGSETARRRTSDVEDTTANSQTITGQLVPIYRVGQKK